jgi:hypothetical protein
MDKVSHCSQVERGYEWTA